MAKINQFWKDGVFWKIILVIIGAAMAYGALVRQVNDTTAQTKENSQQLSSTQGDVRELKKDIQYIRESVNRIEKKINEW